MKKFWNFGTRVVNEKEERTLRLDGTIAEESWFDDDVTPAEFKKELEAGNGPITVWINSPGGDCIAAAQIYNMLMTYAGKVTVVIDGIAASAASVIAMAGDRIVMSPVANMMIHNPLTVAWGNHKDFEQAIQMLDSVKETIINAYEIKTGLSRDEISDMMDAETWMDANEAVRLHFADEIAKREDYADFEDDKTKNKASTHFARNAAAVALLNKMIPAKPQPKEPEKTFKAEDLMAELKNLESAF